MAKNNQKSGGTSEAERLAEVLQTQKYLLEKWARETVDPKKREQTLYVIRSAALGLN